MAVLVTKETVRLNWAERAILGSVSAIFGYMLGVIVAVGHLLVAKSLGLLDTPLLLVFIFTAFLSPVLCIYVCYRGFKSLYAKSINKHAEPNDS